MQIEPDFWPEDISWQLYDGEGKEILSATYITGAARGFIKCFATPDACWRFKIMDAYNNGLCCLNGAGWYKLFWNEEEIFKSDGKYKDHEVTKGCGKYRAQRSED